MDNTMSFFIESQGNDKTRTRLGACSAFSRRLYQASIELKGHVGARAGAGVGGD